MARPPRAARGFVLSLTGSFMLTRVTSPGARASRPAKAGASTLQTSRFDSSLNFSIKSFRAARSRRAGMPALPASVRSQLFAVSVEVSSHLFERVAAELLAHRLGESERDHRLADDARRPHC